MNLKEADNLVKEADKQADGVMNTTNQQIAKMRGNAQKRVEGLQIVLSTVGCRASNFEVI